MMKRLLASLLAVTLCGQEAFAIVVSRAPVAPVNTGVSAVPRVNGLPGGVMGLQPAGPGLVSVTPGVSNALTAIPSLAPAAPLLAVPDAAVTAGIPVLPPSAVGSVFAAPAEASRVGLIAAASHDAAAPVDSKTQLTAAVSGVAAAESVDAKAWTLERLFTGAREALGLASGPAAVAPAALIAAADAPTTPASLATRAGEAGRATPPASVSLVGRGLYPGETLLSAPADAPKSAAPAVPAAPAAPNKGDDWVDWHGVKWMMTQRTISTAVFILTAIAYPMVVIPAVGVAEFGALMALGPIAAIALGPVNGMLAAKMDNPRKGLAYLSWLRAGLAVVLPVLALTGNVTFFPLLLASIANGWQFSLLMTSESAFMAKFAGRNQLPKLTTLGFTTYFMLQVAMGTLLVVGGFIDAWDPMVPFWISAVVNFALGFLVLAKIPDIAPDAGTLAKRAAAKAAADAKSFSEKAREFGQKAGAFFKKFWKETALFAASVGLYAFGLPVALPFVGVVAAGSPLWMSGALMYWVTRSDAFKKMWATGPVRNAILLSALSAALFYPFQNLALPIVATALGSKALVYGQLLGAFFFGQLIANAAKASNLPVIAGKPLEFWIRHAVVAMGVAWASLRLFAGDPLTMLAAGAGAAALGYALISVTKHLTDRGWIKFLGVGLAGTLGVAAFWGSYPAIFASVMLMGLFLGPFVSAINGYIGKFSTNEQRAMNFGVSGSLFNAATSVGYALMTMNLTLHSVPGASPFPAALWPIVAVFLAAGALFYLAPKFLPGLPEKSFTPFKWPWQKADAEAPKK